MSEVRHNIGPLAYHHTKMPKGAKHWVFTINNYKDEDVQLLRNVSEREGVVYLVFGREKGEQGTPHLQGYLQHSSRRSLAYNKRDVHAAAHWEIARGTPTEASNYCKKDGDFEEFGEMAKGQGTRNDLSEVVALIKQGASKRKIAETHPAAVIRYGRGIDALRICQKPPKRMEPPQIQVHWGESGLGKTRRVHTECPDEEELWVHPNEGKWFDGYDGQPYALLDEFDGGWWKLSYTLRLLDRYTMQVPTKGGFTWWIPKKIYITANMHPDEWYPHANEHQRNALMRRLREFGKIIHFPTPL